MAITLKQITGKIVIPGTTTGIRAKVTATPLTTATALTFPADDTISWGPVVGYTTASGQLPSSFKIPTNPEQSEVWWKFVAEPVDKHPGVPQSWTMGSYQFSGSTAEDLADLVEIDLTAVDPALVVTVTDLVNAAEAAAATAATKATEADGFAEAALDSAADADSSADLAAASQTAAASSASGASTSASSASTSAATATTKAGEASTSAAAAAASQTAAAASASAAATSATAAQTAETNAETAETGAVAAKVAAEAVGSTNDAIIAGRINDGASATAAALAATFVPKVSATTQSIEVTGAEKPALRAGSGAARGNPTGTITAITNGAGAVTATRRYAYTELDGHGGETALSPSSTGLALTAQRAKLTVPAIRPGMTDRVIYASDDAGTTWHKLGLFNVSGHSYAGSVYLDNNATLSGAAPPVADNTEHWQFSTGNDGMSYFRRTEAVSDVSDLTVLTGNPAVAGSLSIDAYGQLLVRAGGPAAMPGITSQVIQSTGGSGTAFQAHYVPDDGVGASTQVFRVAEKGQVTVVGYGDVGGPMLGVTPTDAQIAATGGIVRIAAPAGTTNPLLRLNGAGTGDLISTDDNKFRVLADGSLNLQGGTGTNYLGVSQAKRLLTAPTTDVVQLTMTGVSGQANNLAEWYNNTPTRLGRITNYGTLELTPQASTPAISITPAVAVTVTNLFPITLPAGSSAHGLTITNNGTGDTLRSGDGKFRVLADGSINASTSTGANYLPDVRAVTRLVVGSGMGGTWGTGNLAIANTAGAPGSPTSGGVLYVEAGALKWKGSSGTITTIAAA